MYNHNKGKFSRTPVVSFLLASRSRSPDRRSSEGKRSNKSIYYTRDECRGEVWSVVKNTKKMVFYMRTKNDTYMR